MNHLGEQLVGAERKRGVRATAEPLWLRALLLALTGAFLLFFLVLPLATVFSEALSPLQLLGGLGVLGAVVAVQLRSPRRALAAVPARAAAATAGRFL